MNYSNSRSKMSLKVTKEELAQLDLYLSQKCASELIQIIQVAASTSAEAAHVLLRVINDNSANKPVSFQPVKVSQTTYQPFPASHPGAQPHAFADSAEDSEMSGTDSSTCMFGARRPSSSVSHSLRYSGSNSSNKIPANPAKRKFLADREENIPSPRMSLHKKRKSLEMSPDAKRIFCKVNSPTVQKHRCVNCSRYVDGHEWDNLHGCIHHPGYLTVADIWSCCQSSSLVRGCLVSTHSEVARTIIGTSNTPMMPEQMVT